MATISGHSFNIGPYGKYVYDKLLKKEKKYNVFD
jgi:hypothetical protein